MKANIFLTSSGNIPSSTNPLFKLENLIVTPHTAFFSQESTLELEQRGAMEVVKVMNAQTGVVISFMFFSKQSMISLSIS